MEIISKIEVRPHFRVRMKKDPAIEDQVDKEAERDDRRDRASAEELPSQVHRFGQEIKERYAQDRSGREAEDKVELVLEFKRDQTTAEGGQKREECDADYHDRRL